MDERPALLEDAQRFDVSVADRPADLDRTLRAPQGLLAVGEQLGGHYPLDPRQPTLLRALGLIGEERHRALEPPTCHRDGCSAGMVEREMERDHRRGPDLTVLDEPGVGALARSNALLEPAGPERGFAELLHVPRRELAGAVGVPKKRERTRPVVSCDGGTPAHDQLAHSLSLRTRANTRCRNVAATGESEVTMGSPTGIDGDAPVLARHEIDIRAPLETVWQLHTNVNAWPSWQTDISAAQLDGEFESGASFAWTSSGLSITSTIYDVTDRSRTLWGGTAEGITGIHEWTFRDMTQGVLVSTNESFAGAPVERDPSPMQSILDTSLVSWLLRLKATAEARA